MQEGKDFFYVKKWFLGSRRVFYAYKEDRMQKECRKNAERTQGEREKQMWEVNVEKRTQA